MDLAQLPRDAARQPSPEDVFRLVGTPAAGAGGRPVPVSLAAEDDDGEELTGEVVAWPSIFDVPYRMGAYTFHEFQPGAFDDSVADQDGRVPIYVQHGWDWTEQAPLGHSTAITEATRPTDDLTGMRLEGRLYIDTDPGLSVARALNARALREWSIGYRIIEYVARDEDDEDRLVLQITEAELLEASVVLRGANPLTSTEHAAGHRVHRPAPAPDLPEPDTAEPAASSPLDELAVLAGTSPSFRAAWRRTTRHEEATP